MKILGVIVGAAILLSSAHASIVVANADFEAGGALANSEPIFGDWELGISGWTTSGTAGVMDPNLSGNAVYNSAPAAIGTRVAFLAPGASMSQTLGTVIAAGTSYTLSALFGDRVTHVAGGSFGFYAGNTSNIIGTTSVINPGDGLWASQSYTLDAAFLAAYVGQQLGIIFFGGSTGQLNIDAVSVSEQVVPLPAAIWLFGSALLGGGLIKRRKKAKAA